MALERKWPAVAPQAFTSDGNQFGLIIVADTKGFRVKQSAVLTNSTPGVTLPVQIKRVISKTQLVVGQIDNKIAQWPPLDISTWTVASGAAISAGEQDKNNVPEKDHWSAIYEGDPVVADRVIFVDQYGNFYDDNNPLPISFDGTVTVGAVKIQDSAGNPLTSTSGSLNVNVTGGGSGGGIAQTQVRSALNVWTDVGYAGGDLNMPVQVQSALPAGTNLLGKVGIDQTTPGTTNRVAANLDLLAGSPFSATNYLPARITNGTAYVDPTQIRALTASDVVSAAQSGAWTVKAQLQDNAGTAITLGQKTMSSSLPVTLSSDQSALPVSQSGTWTVQQGTSPWSVSQSGTWTTGRTWTLGSGTDSVTAIQGGSWSVANFPTTVDTNYGTIGASSLRTAAQIGNATGAAAFGAGTTSAQVLRVVLPTDQSAIPASQSGTWNINNISGTISLPTGAATSANQTTQITSLNQIDTDLLAFKSANHTDLAALLAVFPSPIDVNYGTVGAKTLRSAAQIGNATGAADFGSGATGAQTLRTATNLYDGSANALTSELIGSKRALDVSSLTNNTATSGSANSLNGIVFTLDATGYTTAYIYSSASPANGAATTVTSIFEVSNDNVNWITTPAQTLQYELAPAGGSPGGITGSTYMVQSGAATQPYMFKVRINGRYLRQRLDFYTGSGSTVTSTVYLSSVDSNDYIINTNTVITDQLGLNSMEFGQNTMSSSIPVVIASDQTAIPVTVSSLPSTVDTNFGTVGANTLRSAAQIGNATGAAAFGAGTTSAQVLRVVLPTDQSAIPATQSGTWTVQQGGAPWSVSQSGAPWSVSQSGTWTVQQGTPPWSVVGNIASGSADSGNPLKVGGVFNTAFPTLSNGQRGDIQLDSSARQVIAPLTNASIVKSQLQDNAGTAITLGQKTMASSLPVAIASDQTAIPASQSGTWTVQQGGAPWSVSQSGTWTVQQGTPPWQTVGNVASGAADSGNPVKVGGVFNTAFPTLTNGQRGDIQLDSSARQVIAPLTNTSVVKSQLQDNAGTAVTLGQKTMASSLPVAIASDQTAIPASQSGTWTVQQGGAPWSVSQSGTWTVQPGNTPNTAPWLTANKDLTSITQSLNMTATTNAVTLALGTGQSVTGVQITGATWTGTIIFEGNIDGTNWFTINAVVPTSGSIATTTTANGQWLVPVAGLASFRVRCSVTGTNSATVSLQASTGETPTQGNSLPTGSNTIGAVTQASGPWTNNVTQFGGTNISTGTGAGGAGIPRVTVSNDSNVLATQSGNWTARIVGNTGVALDAADNATAPTNSVLYAGLYSTTIPALSSGNSAAARLDSTAAQYVNNEGRKATYSCAVVDFAPISTATAPSFSITGSATKTVRITRIAISATAATGGVATLNLQRFSALSGGTSASQSGNIAKHDTNNATATAVVRTWSVAATTATGAGFFRSLRFEFPTPAVTVQPVLYEWDFGDKNGQSLVLRGTSDFIGLCFNGIGTTPTAEIYVEWTEE